MEDRETIEQMLRSLKSFGAITERLGKSKLTISRKIRKHTIRSDKSALHRIVNRCKHRYECHKHYICRDDLYTHSCSVKQCRYYKHCNPYCKDYQEETCKQLMNPPYVCNACTTKPKCMLRKKYNIAKIAEKQYRYALLGCQGYCGFP